MARLFAADKIRVVPFGPPSKMRTKIVVSNDPSNPASDAFQPVPTGCVPTPPITPTPVGRGKGALEAPAPPNGDPPAAFSGGEGAGSAYEVIAPAPAGKRCVRCGEGSGVRRVQWIEHAGGVDLLHEDCAEPYLAADGQPSSTSA
jgi:hypothetical protein